MKALSILALLMLSSGVAGAQPSVPAGKPILAGPLARPGLRFQDGHPLTTADVKWSHENDRGYDFKVFHDELEHIQIVDDRTIVCHFDRYWDTPNAPFPWPWEVWEVKG